MVILLKQSDGEGEGDGEERGVMLPIICSISSLTLSRPPMSSKVTLIMEGRMTMLARYSSSPVS